MPPKNEQFHLPLRTEFDDVVSEIEQQRRNEEAERAVREGRAVRPINYTTGFYAEIGNAVFKTALGALKESFRPLEASTTQPPRLHVLSAPAGSGKSTFAAAFMIAAERYSEKLHGRPCGCLYVVNEIKKADEAYQHLAMILPGKVAVWTSEHDPSCRLPEGERKVSRPAAQFSKDDLQNYPIAIITHAFFTGKGRRKATHFLQDGKLRPRVLTFIDERIEGVTVFDVALSAAQKLRETIMADAALAETAGPAMEALLDFMWPRGKPGKAIERSTDEPAAWGAAESKEIQWFATGAAAAFVEASRMLPDIVPVFGFARALATGYAFIVRKGSDEKATHYVGYENNMDLLPGSVLLDATADIDGVVQLCPWRTLCPVPPAYYDNLHVVSIPPHTKTRLSKYLATPSNRKAYTAWMIDTIKEHMAPDQKGLVVCKKYLFDQVPSRGW